MFNLTVNAMSKIFNGNFYKGFSEPVNALDPADSLVYGASGLVICRKCLEPYGKAVKVISVSRASGRRRSSWHYQKCRCEREFDLKNKEYPPLWPDHDFNLSVEFCYCCGSRLVNTGHFKDPFFCDECLSLVRQHNSQPGNFRLPVCRFSPGDIVFYTSGARLSGWDIQERRWASYHNRTRLLLEWRQLILFEHLADSGIGFTNDIAVTYYDRLLLNMKIDRCKIFESMIPYIYSGYLDIPERRLRLNR